MKPAAPDKIGVLAARQAIPEAQHPRAPEPTAASVLAGVDPASFVVVGDNATVHDALKIMAERDSCAVAVASPTGFSGIFSERDHARKSSPGATLVVDVMTRFVAGVAPADSLRHCLGVMKERRVTHLAVLDQGRLVGLLSETDLLKARIAHHERIFRETEMDQKLLFLRGTYSC
jgi:signal-transduction protein with cAMP-binding, CBS, and nucleotidyltransferase domain